MFQSVFFALALVASAADEPRFPLRTDAPAKEWKSDEINNALPCHWVKGAVHVLAWEVVEEVGEDRRTQSTQAMVLKRFDQPTETDGHRWVLAHVIYNPENKGRPWRSREMWRIGPPAPGEKMPKFTAAQKFGYEFYKDLPTDKQIETFVRETRWRPTVGPREAFTFSDDGKLVKIKYTTKVPAGGVDRTLWKSLFAREVPIDLFPELKEAMHDRK